jgi:malate permease and related proteins
MKYFWFYLLFYGSLALGMLARRWKNSASLIMRLTLLFIDAPLLLFSFWILDIKRFMEYIPIPIMGVILVVLPLWFSPFVARRILSDRKSQGSFILTSSFSNIGTTGGSFICYLLFGLQGLSMGYLFLLPYPFLIFTAGFSVARKYAFDTPLRLKDYFLNIAANLFSVVPLLSIAAGFLLNMLNVQPPGKLEIMADIWIKLGLGLMCLAIGMTLQLKHILASIKQVLFLGLIKFITVPAVAFIAVLIIYGAALPLAAKIIIIQSFMPPAIYAVIISNLYDLDRDLANSLWFSATLLLIPIAGMLLLLFH